VAIFCTIFLGHSRYFSFNLIIMKNAYARV
jgi:hypothetical protein